SMTSYCPVPGPVPTAPANRDYQAGFTAAMMLKDLRLAQEAAQTAGAATPMGAEAAAIYERYCGQGEAGRALPRLPPPLRRPRDADGRGGGRDLRALLRAGRGGARLLRYHPPAAPAWLTELNQLGLSIRPSQFGACSAGRAKFAVPQDPPTRTKRGRRVTKG